MSANVEVHPNNRRKVRDSLVGLASWSLKRAARYAVKEMIERAFDSLHLFTLGRKLKSP